MSIGSTGGFARGFNEAAADTAENGRWPRSDGRWPARGFNEAAADTAENADTSATTSGFSGGFNEAAADTAENDVLPMPSRLSDLMLQ